MYVRRGVRLASIIADSWLEQVIIFVWTGFVILLHEGLSVQALAMPILPVSVIGIAISLYLGSQSSASYARWWEARQGLGVVAAMSRVWAMQVRALLGDATDEPAMAPQRQLIMRHLGNLYAFAYELRRTSRLAAGRRWAIFAGRRSVDPATLLAAPTVFERFVSPEEYKAALASRTPWTYLLSRQAIALHELTRQGLISESSQQLLLQTLTELHRSQGQCERIKNTPFPRQMAFFGKVFTWIFVLLVPLALLDTLVHEAITHSFGAITTHEYIIVLMSFSQLIGWVFLMMEKIGESTQDPFEGGVHDVPVSTICRGMEIELRQMLGDTDLPSPPAANADVLY